MIRPGLQLARVAGRRMASTAAAAGENEFIANRKAMRDHAVRAFVISPFLGRQPVMPPDLYKTHSWKAQRRELLRRKRESWRSNERRMRDGRQDKAVRLGCTSRAQQMAVPLSCQCGCGEHVFRTEEETYGLPRASYQGGG